MRYTFVALLGLLAGCATPLTDYERADREVLRIEAFTVFEAACERAGGMIEVTRYGWVPRHCSYRACVPNRTDGVRCVSR